MSQSQNKENHFIEFIPNPPFTFLGEAPPKGNIHIDYKLKNVPAHKIRSKSLRQQKERWDRALLYKDGLSLSLKAHKNKFRLPQAPVNHIVFISAILYFKTNYDNIALFHKDGDNVMKIIHDSIEASGILNNDCQIVLPLIPKQSTKNNPRIEIYSIFSCDSFLYLKEWMKRQAEIIPSAIEMDPQINLF